MATQMKEATIANTTYKITSGDKAQYEFHAKGKAVVFDGFMAVYMFDNDKASVDVFLPKVVKNQKLNCQTLDTVQKFTKPPSRYTEASLVKKLEALGIGRPSTYAPTISTIQQREYVIKTEDKKLKPAPIGEVVDGFLLEHFADIVDTGFTAKVEESFDLVANGKITWQEVLKEFYEPFIKNIEHKELNAPRAKFNDSRVLGEDPKTGKPISTNIGRYGPYVQLGNKEDKDENGKELKLKFASIPKEISVDKIDLKQALVLLQLPKVLGIDDNNKEIKVNIGRFGPYIQVGSNYYNIKDDDPYTIKLEKAIQIIQEQEQAKAKALVKEFADDDIKIIDGVYGFYIKHKKKNYKLPKKLSREELESLSLEEAQEYIKESPKKKKYVKKSKQ
jgi:DNA topoisomerase-1